MIEFEKDMKIIRIFLFLPFGIAVVGSISFSKPNQAKNIQEYEYHKIVPGRISNTLFLLQPSLLKIKNMFMQWQEIALPGNFKYNILQPHDA